VFKAFAGAGLLWLSITACRGDGRSKPVAGDRAAPVVEPAARPQPRPVTPALLDAIAAMAVPGEQVRVLARGERDVALAIVTADGRQANLTASACLGCVPIDLEAWRARRAELASLWAPGADNDPPVNAARLSITTIELAPGVVAIAIAGQRADGRAVTIAHWNDGSLQLQAVCERAATACGELVRESLIAARGALP